LNETFALVLGFLGSAAIGSVLTSIANGIFSARAQRAELARRDLEMALKLAELKHQQMIAVQEWNQKSGRDADVSFFDPLVTVIGYDRGIKEYRKTGRWDKGETAHGRPKA
jgi:hypothetical protein